MANTKVSQLSSLSNIDSTTVFLVSSNTSGTLTSYKTPISSVSNAVTANLGNIKSTNLDGNSSNVLYGNGVFSTVVANTVDILNTNGLTTVFYPTFVENRTTNQIVRADVDLTYRTDTNTLTVGNLTINNTANITGNIIGNTNGFTIGYLNVPQVAASNVTIAASDAGKHYYSTTAANLTLTIPNNATTSFDTGTAISIVVQAAGNVLVNAASGVTLYMAGNSTAANRVVGTYGMATLLKVASDTWFINGTGVS